MDAPDKVRAGAKPRPLQVIHVLGGPVVNRREAEKARREREVFAEFCNAVGLSVDLKSIVSRRSPRADVECLAGGKVRSVELVEITGEALAGRVSLSFRTGRPTGGPLSPEQPLFGAFVKKASRRYETGGAPLYLLAYYDRQPSVESVDTQLVVGGVAQAMVSFGGWTASWVFDRRSRCLLWSYPRKWQENWL